MLPSGLCYFLLRHAICFFAAAACDVTIPEDEQTADDTNGLNLAADPSCNGAICTVPSGSSITMQANAGFGPYCQPDGTVFTFWYNGQCMTANVADNTEPGLFLHPGTDVVYTCTNGNLEVALPILLSSLTYINLDQVTEITCGGDLC